MPCAKQRGSEAINRKRPILALTPTPPDKKDEKQAAQANVLLREVDEALRQDEMADLFRRHGKTAIAVVTAGLLGLAGYLWWDNNSKADEGKRGEQLVVALDSIGAGNLGGAEKQLKPLAESEGANAFAAKLMRAGIALEQNRSGEAQAIFAAVAADADAPQPYRDLATIREVAVGFDAMKPEQVVTRLKPLATPGKPWFGPAGELLGLAYMKQGKPELAGPLFAQISRDKEAPESLRRRTGQMAGLLGVDPIDDAEAAARADANPDAPAQ